MIVSWMIIIEQFPLHLSLICPPPSSHPSNVCHNAPFSSSASSSPSSSSDIQPLRFLPGSYRYSAHKPYMWSKMFALPGNTIISPSGSLEVLDSWIPPQVSLWILSLDSPVGEETQAVSGSGGRGPRTQSSLLDQQPACQTAATLPTSLPDSLPASPEL